MIGQKIQKAFNEQIQHELASAYLYLSMAAYFHAESLDGMAAWMKAQANEELAHAMRFFDHIDERGGRVELRALSEPKREWSSPLAAFEAAYDHERFITGRIEELARLADAEGDRASGVFLQWFVSEQVEEEASVSKVVDMLKRIGDAGHGLVMIDRELGRRGSGE